MRHRASIRLPHRATITRYQESGSNEIGEPIQSETTVAEDVPCKFSDEGTQFVRSETGERVERPARIRLPPGTDVQEGDEVSIDTREEETYEVRSVQEVTGTRRGRPIKLKADLERA